jgi:hypothetical protein
MRKFILLNIFILFFIQLNAINSPVPAINNVQGTYTSFPVLPENTARIIASLKIKEVEKLLGRKMKLKEKLAFKLYQIKVKRDARRAGEKANNGTTSMILGIAGIASLFIPYVSIAAIPCMILALVFGYSTKKHYPDDKHAKTGIILGWIGVGLLVIAVAVVIALFAGGLGWG